MMWLGTMCLVITTAGTAMALEHEFHGEFIGQFDSSTFNRTLTTDYNATRGGYYDPSGLKKGMDPANFFEQRSQLTYNAKAGADLKLVTVFDLDYAYWGDRSYTAGNGSGGTTGGDLIRFVAKNVFLDYKIRENLTIKLGAMPINDPFKGVLFDANMAGVLLSGTYGVFSPSIGYFRIADKGASINKVLGANTKDMFLFDSKFQITERLKVGAAYYFLRDGTPDGKSSVVVPAVPDTVVTEIDADGNPHDVTLAGTGSPAVTAPTYNDVALHIMGLNAEYIRGPLTLSGFAIYETGTNNKRTTSAFAANLGAKIKNGPGTIRVEFLYVSGDQPDSGDSGAFYSAPGDHGYYANEMAIIGRDKYALTTDNSIVYNVGNRGQGQIGGYLGYDRPFTPAFDMSFNAGFVAVAEETAAKPFIYSEGIITGSKNRSNFLGSEFNVEANYKVRDNLKISLRGAYAILGEYYKGVALQEPPMNVYDAKLRVSYTF